MGKTSIEWTRGDDGSMGRTWNPVRGCSRVSEGCRNCYAERMAARFSGARGFPHNGNTPEPFFGFAEPTPSGPRWTGKVELIPELLDEPLRWRKPQRVFVNSMSDLFHESLSDGHIDLVFAVMAHCSTEWHRCRARSCDHDLCNENTLEQRQPHTFQVLTKRPERARLYLNAPDRLDRIRAAWQTLGWYFENPPVDRAKWPLPNVWLGVSVEDQSSADKRIPILLQTPAAVRFISAEPLLAPINLRTIGTEPDPPFGFRSTNALSDESGLHWVIVGGESGPNARPCDVQWIREIVEDCSRSKVQCFVKQLGARPFAVNGGCHPNLVGCDHISTSGGACDCCGRVPLVNRKGGDISEWAEDLRVREFPEVRA